jgi:hypothetical protein
MSTERRRAGSRSHLGSRSTSEYVCDHHVRRLRHERGVAAVLRLLSLIKCRSLMGFGSSRRRLSSCDCARVGGTRESASDLLSFDLVCAQLVWLVASRCVVHQNITFERVRRGARVLDLNQWMTLQMSTERRRAGSRSHLGSRSTSEYVCDHHVRRLRHERGVAAVLRLLSLIKCRSLMGFGSSRRRLSSCGLRAGRRDKGIGIRPVEF